MKLDGSSFESLRFNSYSPIFSSFYLSVKLSGIINKLFDAHMITNIDRC